MQANITVNLFVSMPVVLMDTVDTPLGLMWFWREDLRSAESCLRFRSVTSCSELSSSSWSQNFGGWKISLRSPLVVFERCGSCVRWKGCTSSGKSNTNPSKLSNLVPWLLLGDLQSFEVGLGSWYIISLLSAIDDQVEQPGLLVEGKCSAILVFGSRYNLSLWRLHSRTLASLMENCLPAAWFQWASAYDYFQLCFRC